MSVRVDFDPRNMSREQLEQLSVQQHEMLHKMFEVKAKDEKKGILGFYIAGLMILALVFVSLCVGYSLGSILTMRLMK